MPKLPSRLRIHEYLRVHQTATSTELSHALQMTPANIRHHLAILESNDIIELAGQKRGEGRGRPVNVFSLSRRVLGDNLDRLVDAMFSEWMRGISQEAQVDLLQAVAHRLAFPAGGGKEDNESLGITQRLSKAVKRLNELHYQARWEAGAQGPRIILGHCPYKVVIDSHPELCQIDAFILSTRLDAPARQITKLEQGMCGTPFCAFVIR
jgi:predicted ArsR family transcriptional regulator